MDEFGCQLSPQHTCAGLRVTVKEDVGKLVDGCLSCCTSAIVEGWKAIKTLLDHKYTGIIHVLPAKSLVLWVTTTSMHLSLANFIS